MAPPSRSRTASARSPASPCGRSSKRRGIGGAITLHLTRAAHAAGAGLVFLTPAGDAQERVYARVGYRRTDSVLFLTKETS